MLGKGQIYLPREGFKKAYSWAEGVVTDKQEEKVGNEVRDILNLGDIFIVVTNYIQFIHIFIIIIKYVMSEEKYQIVFRKLLTEELSNFF